MNCTNINEDSVFSNSEMSFFDKNQSQTNNISLSNQTTQSIKSISLSSLTFLIVNCIQVWLKLKSNS